MCKYKVELYFHVYTPTGDWLKDEYAGTWLTKSLVLPCLPFEGLRIYTHEKQEVRDIICCVAYDAIDEVVYALVRPILVDDGDSVGDYVQEQRGYGWKTCKAEKVPECFSGIEVPDRYED